MRVSNVLAVLAFASSALATPVITSVTPRSGPVTGGTTVQIHGTGFSNECVTCSPPFADPQVYFGSAPAASVRYMGPNLIEAVTPRHIPVDVSVSVYQADGADPNYDVFENGFSFEGDVYTAFDPLLFPIFVPPVPGQAGSEFVTTARLWNKGLTPVSFFGYDRTCTLIDPPISATDLFGLAPREEYELTLFPECSDSIAKLFFIPKGDESLAASLRVSETSKQAQNHGVEIPVVRLEDFSEESIALLDVPVDPKFRLTLRIYGLNRGTNFVNVSFGNRAIQVPLRRGQTLFDPSYAEVTDFAPADTAPPSPRRESMTVLVDVPRGAGGVNIPGSPIWAFITVTNNETQHITTITPQQ
jgi:hypothetical protein